MNNSPQEIRLPLSDFDKSLLKSSDALLEGDALRRAIKEFFEEHTNSKATKTDVLVTSTEIILRSSNAMIGASMQDQAIDCLTAGNYEKGISLLEIVLSIEPEDEDSLYNLGMALSDVRRLDESEKYLTRLIQVNPQHARGWLALGVCHARNNRIEEAESSFRSALRIDENDEYTLKTLGAFLVEIGGDLKEAEGLLRKALVSLPDDQQLWFNVGRLCEKLDDSGGADEAYIKAIDLNAYNDIGGAAKKARSAIAEKTFKGRNPSEGDVPRPDAMMYCLDAMNKFKGLPVDDVRKITFEIATLGMSGLDVNDPDQKYQIRSLNGKFSGLHLLSIEYVGFKMIDPSVDLGFDLTKEYAAAKAMQEAG